MMRPVHLLLKSALFIVADIFWLKHSCRWAFKLFENHDIQTLFIVIPHMLLGILLILVVAHEFITHPPKCA